VQGPLPRSAWEHCVCTPATGWTCSAPKPSVPDLGLTAIPFHTAFLNGWALNRAQRVGARIDGHVDQASTRR
jgi:hypothetical protein